MSARRQILAAFGMVLLVAGVLLPAGWFTPLPPTMDLPPPPVSGHVLVRAALFIEGCVLVWLGWRRPAAVGDMPVVSLVEAVAPSADDEQERRLYVWLLCGVTLLALVLRLIALDSDLWLDEITPIQAYRDASPLQIASTYRSSNNHLLNTLLVKAAMAIFGEREWAIRLPAVVWGTATIPIMYWVARQALSRHASLAAAGLLAVSYHHVFFSQNARGYTAYLFLSLASSVLLVQGMATGRRRVWAAYVVASVLNFAALLIGAFVFAGHIIVGWCVTWTIRADARLRARMARSLLIVFSVTAFLGFQLYAAALPQMYVLIGVVYTEATSGFQFFSIDLVRELARGLGAGFGPGLLLGAVPVLALAAAGYVVLLRRHWILALALTLPCVLQAGLLLARGFTFSPRFFILALPLAILVAVQAIVMAADAAARALGRGERFARWSSAMVATLLAVASVTALPRYYGTPKQAYRAALTHVESIREPQSTVIEIHYAEAGFRYYRGRLGLGESPGYAQARTVERLEELLADRPGRPIWLLTTFPRALRTGVPDLDARIKRDWQIERTFAGTIGDGDTVVWRMKSPRE